jgi:hypothetical protein
MKRLLVARLALALVGLAVWGYGKSADIPNLRVAAMGILLIALAMRFAPRRWFEDGDPE